MKAVFLASGAGQSTLLASVRENQPGTARFCVDPATFLSVPGSPFAYWISDGVRAVYSSSPATESNGRCVRIGIATHDDFRWLRCWWESDLISIVPFAKGGGFARFYADLPLVILWHGDGRQLKVSKLERFRLGELTKRTIRKSGIKHSISDQVSRTRRAARLDFGAIVA